MDKINLQQCEYCHQLFDANLDNGCHNPGCGWVNTPQNTQLLNAMRSDQVLLDFLGQADQLINLNH